MASHPIFARAFHGDHKAVKKILDADSSAISVRDAKNLTPLHVAASRGQHKVAQLLLDYGADVSGPSGKDEWTPLVYAAYRGHVAVARVLIENGAGVSEKHGNPIHFAGQRKHKELCQLLVEHGAVDDLVKSDDQDLIDLFRAAYSYDSASVKQILTRRPKLVNRLDKNRRTPLHEACTQGDTKTVKVLLSFGADIAKRDKFKQTPVDRATSHRQRSVLKWLEKEAAKSK